MQRGCLKRGQIHGSAIFSLPADFLCKTHQAEFYVLAEVATEEVWADWLQRLQMKIPRDGDVVAQRSLVLAEAKRFRRREDAMASALRGDEGFGDFCRLVDLCEFDQTMVQKSVLKSQLVAVRPQ